MGDLSDRMCEQGGWGPDSYRGESPLFRRLPPPPKPPPVMKKKKKKSKKRGGY